MSPSLSLAKTDFGHFQRVAHEDSGENWLALVEALRLRAQRNGELYRVFSRGVRFYLCRHRALKTWTQGS